MSDVQLQLPIASRQVMVLQKRCKENKTYLHMNTISCGARCNHVPHRRVSIYLPFINIRLSQVSPVSPGDEWIAYTNELPQTGSGQLNTLYLQSYNVYRRHAEQLTGQWTPFLAPMERSNSRAVSAKSPISLSGDDRKSQGHKTINQSISLSIVHET